MSSGILNRENYSQRTLETFEIIGAYYVDIFYNHLYTEARKLKSSGNVSSITEGYKHTLNAFLQSLSNPKLYKKSISGIHHYFITIGYSSISFGKCIDRITCEFVPIDFFQSLSSFKKMGILKMIINQSIKSFTRKIVDSHMIKIIDYHKDKDNVRILQDDFIDCLIMEREGMYHRFVYKQTTTNKNETVNRELAEKMQQEIKKLISEKHALNKKNILYNDVCIKMKRNEHFLINKLKYFEEQNKALTQQVNDNNKIIDNNMSEINHLKTLSISTRITPNISTPNHDTPNISTPNHDTQHVSEQTDNDDSYNIVDNTDAVSESGSTFIEVNESNINDILQKDPDQLNTLKNTPDIYNEGTMLDDFS